MVSRKADEKDELFAPRPADPGEARVRALRDALARAAGRLDVPGGIEVEPLHDGVRAALDGLEKGDLGSDESTVTRQLRACLKHLGDVAERDPGPVSADAHGLPGDARFLREMAEFLTRKFLGDEEPPADSRRRLPVLPTKE